MSEATPAPKKKKRKLLIILIMAAVVMLSLALALGIAIAFPPTTDTGVGTGTDPECRPTASQCDGKSAGETVSCSGGTRCICDASSGDLNPPTPGVTCPSILVVSCNNDSSCSPAPPSNPSCNSLGGSCSEGCFHGQFDNGVCDLNQICCRPAPTSSSGTPPPAPPPPASWGACGSCNTCPTDQLHQCRTNPEGACVWDPGGCSTGGPPPGQPLECYPEDNPSSSCDGKQFNASCGTNRRCRQQSGNGWANFRPCRCVAVSTSSSSSSGEVVEPPPVAVPDPVVLPDTAVFEDSVLAIMTGIFLLLLGTLLAYHSEYWGRKFFRR